jgi:group I intron endonuclease
MKQPVIYRIRNVTNGKFYVGSTVNTQERFRTHRKKLRSGKHHCAHLQAAWNKYGEDCFKFEVIEVVIGQNLQTVEDEWLARYVGKPECYNVGLRSGAPWRGGPKEKHPNFGRPKTEAERQAISQSLREFYAADPSNHPRAGKKHSEEARAKIRAAIQGKIASGEQHYRYGKTLSEDVRKKIGDTQRGVKKAPRKITEEGMAKIRAAAAAGRYSHMKGKKLSIEVREKMSRKVFATPDGIKFPSLTAVLEHYGIKMPTLQRALKSGKPISKGRLTGYTFQYSDGGMITDNDRALIEAQKRRKIVDTPNPAAYTESSGKIRIPDSPD